MAVWGLGALRKEMSWGEKSMEGGSVLKKGEEGLVGLSGRRQ